MGIKVNQLGARDGQDFISVASKLRGIAAENNADLPTLSQVRSELSKNRDFAIWNPFSRVKVSGNTIVIPPHLLNVSSDPIVSENEVILTESNIDDGTTFSGNGLGVDWYIYKGKDSEGATVFCLSKNMHSPDAAAGMVSYRILGGVHYGKIRNSLTASDVSNGLVSASAWDLSHMPVAYLLGLANPPSVRTYTDADVVYQLGGMLEVRHGLWADIYLVSDDNTSGISTTRDFAQKAFSRIDKLPITGTEGLNWFDFVIRARNVGKRLLTYSEWIELAAGSPQGNDSDNVNGWTKTTNTGRVKTATTISGDSDANYVLGQNTSILGARDCVGNIWEWLTIVSQKFTGGLSNNNFYDQLDTGENSENLNFGQYYSYNTDSIYSARAGGGWANGVKGGSRALSVGVDDVPWNVHTSAGSRFACDSI